MLRKIKVPTEEERAEMFKEVTLEREDGTTIHLHTLMSYEEYKKLEDKAVKQTREELLYGRVLGEGEAPC